MNSKQAVERLREIKGEFKIDNKKLIPQNEKYRDWAVNNNRYWNVNSFRDFLKQEAKEIYEQFKDGCRKDLNGYSYNYYCGQIGIELNRVFCPKCQEIKEISSKFALSGGQE
jgi:hypothetical protein